MANEQPKTMAEGVKASQKESKSEADSVREQVEKAAQTHQNYVVEDARKKREETAKQAQEQK